MKFEVLIDESFSLINKTSGLHPIANKHVLSLINDFESGGWRFKKFQQYIWDNIAETALSKEERDSLINNAQTTLIESAKNLRLTGKDTIGTGSELSEILLYGIMKDHYKALSVVPKIFYKQNIQDNAKGADSVHIVIENNDFSLWFGEAKFYKDISGAIIDAIKSIGNFFSGSQIRKENSIITNVKDLHSLKISNHLIEEIENSLNESSSLDKLKPKIHIPILLLHECKITENSKELTQDYKDKIVSFHKENANKYFKKQIKELDHIFKYSDISFHLILFPIPDKKIIVDAFLDNVSHYKGQ